MEKVAIVGGGMAGLAAALELSDPKSPTAMRVTLYQEGSRLGGKLATTRVEEHRLRSHEHGLHMFGGFYENTFALLRRHLPNHPWFEDDAGGVPEFCPRGRIAFSRKNPLDEGETVKSPEENRRTFLGHPFDDPPWSNREPGEDAADGLLGPTPTELYRRAIEFVFGENPKGGGFIRDIEAPPWLDEWVAGKRNDVDVDRHAEALMEGLEWSVWAGWDRLQPDPALTDATQPLTNRERVALERELRAQQDRVARYREARRAARKRDKDKSKGNDGALAKERARQRRFIVLTEVAVASLLGMARHDVFEKGFGVLDCLDFRRFLRNHGASRRARNSAFVRAVYDYLFAYERGDPERGNLAAGVALRIAFRLLFDYRGAAQWVMTRGAGDSVILPIYKLLEERDVELRLFHRVDELVLEDGRVTKLRGTQQRTDWKDYDYIAEKGGLEYWPEPPGTEQETEFTHEVDRVVLATPPNCVEKIASSLERADERWERALASAHTVATRSAQLWFTLEPGKLCDKEIKTPTALIGLRPPFGAWGDMTEMLEFEFHGRRAKPKCLIYLVGTFDESVEDGTGHREQNLRATQRWLEQQPRNHWSGGLGRGKKRFDYRKLFPWGSNPTDLRSALEAQFLCVNTTASARYAQSFAETIHDRLDPNTEYFGNVHVVGDWVATGLNAGCVEAAVMSGLAAARAITNNGRKIYGEWDIAPEDA